MFSVRATQGVARVSLQEPGPVSPELEEIVHENPASFEEANAEQGADNPPVKVGTSVKKYFEPRYLFR